MNFLLNSDINNTTLSEAPAEILGLGGQVVLIGMLTVFAVLGLLWACLTVFKMVFAGSSVKKTVKPTEKEEVVSFIAPVSAPSEDEEIVAVIAAAIAMAESESDSGLKFRVVSFRRT